MIRVGPAGWSYKDWEGIVYPPNPPKSFHRAAYLSQFFNTRSILLLRPAGSIGCARLGPACLRESGVKFTAKLWRGFTHDRNATQQDGTTGKTALDVMAGAGRLGALLLQFPWSFKFTPDSRAYVAELQRRFRDYPLVLEVRHVGWADPNVWEMLADLGMGFCNID